MNGSLSNDCRPELRIAFFPTRRRPYPVGPYGKPPFERALVTFAEKGNPQFSLGGITKVGSCYLRQMLMVRAMAVIRYVQRNSVGRPWLVQLMGRRPTKVAANNRYLRQKPTFVSQR
jgi:hypothetical protein